MVAIALACFVIAVGLGVIALRLNVRAEDLERALDATLDERDALHTEVESLRQAEQAARVERDDALSRVQRSRRDAADVATRLREETTARQEAEGRCVELERQLEGAGLAPLLWGLALDRVSRTWRTSVSPGLGDVSPLEGSSDELRTAIEIEIAAASEEVGADIELTWEHAPDSPPLDPAVSVQVFAVVESVVAATAKSARTTTIEVAVGSDAVEIRVGAVDDAGAPLAVDLPVALAVEPGLARVPRVAPRGEPPGR